MSAENKKASTLVSPATEQGNAIVEFIGVLGGILLPLLIFIIGIATVTTNQFAAAAAARESARAFVRAPTSQMGFVEGERSGNRVVADRGLPPARITFECSAHPCLSPGAVVTAQVNLHVALPFIGVNVPITSSSSMDVDRYRGVR
ncbi:hypothetical protein ACTOVN_05240 [Arcanobacterium canis]